MNDLMIMAILAKWAKDGGDLPPGEYTLDETITLMVSGTIKVSGPVSYTPTVKMPLLTVMAVLLHRMGFQRDRAADLLASAMVEALSIGEKAEGPIGDIVDDITGAMERVRSITEALPKETRRGPTRIEKMRVEIVREDDRLAS